MKFERYTYLVAVRFKRVLLGLDSHTRSGLNGDDLESLSIFDLAVPAGHWEAHTLDGAGPRVGVCDVTDAECLCIPLDRVVVRK